MDIKALLLRYGDVISSIVITEKDVEIIKLDILLNDKSILKVRERTKENKVFKYSYYWFNPKGDLISGWDNAPHHLQVETFPHHKHTVSGKILPSKETNLDEVLEAISKKVKKV